MSVAGTYIEGGVGRILVVIHEPDVVRGVVLVAPAFAEEMNKSRRLIWETASVLAAHGFRTLVPDLHGTGDSEGEFCEARWNHWMEDLCRTAEWARRAGASEVDVLMVRLGAALFRDAREEMPVALRRVVAWQPVHDGAETLRQLLRMKAMADRMAGARAQPIEAMLEALLEGMAPMVLGGYEIAPRLARAIRDASFSPAALRGIAAGLQLDVQPASLKRDGQPASPNLDVHPAALGAPARAATADAERVWQRCAVPGERFWNVIDPAPNPALVNATVNFLVQ